MSRRLRARILAPGSPHEAAGPRRGAILVLATLFLSIALVFTAFVTDIGYISLQQSRIQSAADAAALGASMDFDAGEHAVRDSVDELLRLNGFDPAANPQVVVTPRFGTWDKTQQAFVETAFRDADALQVDIEDRGVPAFFGVALGHEQYTVGASATAGASQLAPLDVVLVLDCSESMSATMANGRTRMQNTHDAALRLIGQLRDEDRVGMAVFSWEDRRRNQYERTGTAERWLNFNTQPTEVRVNQLRAGHYVNRGLGTNIGGGLRAGLDVFLHKGQPRDAESAEIVEEVMVLLTDGQVNLAEPYPVPDAGPSGVAPSPPYRTSYDPKESVRQWAATIRARGIKLYVVTVSDEGLDPLMATVASPPDEQQSSYYYHVADGASDYLELMDVFEAIGGHGRKSKLLQ